MAITEAISSQPTSSPDKRTPVTAVGGWGGTVHEKQTKLEVALPFRRLKRIPEDLSGAQQIYNILTSEAKFVSLAEAAKAATYLQYLLPYVDPGKKAVLVSDSSSVNFTDRRKAGLIPWEFHNGLIVPEGLYLLTGGTDLLSEFNYYRLTWTFDKGRAKEAAKNIPGSIRVISTGSIIPAETKDPYAEILISDAKDNIEGMGRAAGKDFPPGSYIAFRRLREPENGNGKQKDTHKEEKPKDFGIYLYPAYSSIKRSPSSNVATMNRGSFYSPMGIELDIDELPTRRTTHQELRSDYEPHFTDNLTVENVYFAIAGAGMIDCQRNQDTQQNIQNLRWYRKAKVHNILLVGSGSASIPDTLRNTILNIAKAEDTIFYLASGEIEPDVKPSQENEMYFNENRKRSEPFFINTFQAGHALSKWLIRRGILEKRSPRQMQELFYEFCDMFFPQYHKQNTDYMEKYLGIKQ